ncbi:MAG: hypothetical protein EXR00_08480 [Alphaproteobacteria bacterium]|nr:hypothetical protein [Alphaproteobacteria bacterium]
MVAGNRPLRGNVASHFQPFLDKYDFAEDWYEGGAMGEMLQFRSPKFFLRFVSDRGNFGIDICAVTDSRWISINLFLEFLRAHPNYTKVKNDHGVVYVDDAAPLFARALTTHFEHIADLLSPELFEQSYYEFQRFLEERAERLYGPFIRE